jgi:uncharacterized protein
MSATDIQGSTPQAKLPSVDRLVVAAGLGAFLIGGAFLADAFSFRQALLFLVGGLLGATLYHAAFGFTGGWRAFIIERRGASIRSQMLMIALVTVVFIPLLAQGNVFGTALAGATAPIGISVLVGAFIFGLGMQLGGGCGSGTLFTVGGGSVRMLITLAFFIIGAVLGTLHLPWWLELPSLAPISLGVAIGVAPAIVLQVALLALIGWATLVAEKRRHGDAVSMFRTATPGLTIGQRLTQGPWPLVWGAVALAVLNVVTLVVAGHPWSITFAFGLWGAKGLQVLGVDVASWAFWQWPAPAAALSQSVLADTTSVMNFGLILGAMIAAGLAGRYAPRASLPIGSLLAAVVGGLLMGYGARLAFGCNIGALFSGIGSGSLHGWLWFAAAFSGSIIGVRLRRRFGLGA